MEDHPIQGLMKTAMENIKEMVDVTTIVGDPVETPDGSVILPISRVGFGFAAGGSEFKVQSQTSNSDDEQSDGDHPFGGGSGGGVSISPIAFLVVGQFGVKVVPLDNSTHLFERIIDTTPAMVDRLQGIFSKNNNMQQQTMSNQPTMM